LRIRGKLPLVEAVSAEQTVHRHYWLLRACRERPSGYTAAEKRD
jgi:hypothetical protein